MKTEISLKSGQPWSRLFQDQKLKHQLLESVLPEYIADRRWFAGKSSTIKHVLFDFILPVVAGKKTYYLVVLEVIFEESFVHHYFLTLGFWTDTDNPPKPRSIIHPIQIQNREGWLVEAIYQTDFLTFLFTQLKSGRSLKMDNGTLVFDRGSLLKKDKSESVTAHLLDVDQSNTSVIFNDKYFLKLFRRLFRDPNPDVEMVHFLTEKNNFKHTPKYAGSISWSRPGTYDLSLGLMQEKLENEGNAWAWMLKRVHRFFEKLHERNENVGHIQDIPLFSPMKISKISNKLVDLVNYDTLKSISLLARRTAEMHIMLSSDTTNTHFNPVYFNSDFAVWLKNRLIYQFDQRYNLLERNIDLLSGRAKAYAEAFMQSKTLIINEILGFDENRLAGRRIRIHGDYHLGQILVRDNDFYILDFEGEPESTIRDRKVKQTPLKDVAGLFRSFHYAVYATIFDHSAGWTMSEEALFEAGEKYWRCLVSVFMHTYLKLAFNNQLSIGYKPEIDYLLKYNLLEKAIYELGYELQGRPEMAVIPLQGIMQLLNIQFKPS